MSLLIQSIEISNALRAIRELILDVSPVTLAKVKGQGFSFSKSSTDVVVDGVSYTFEELPKVYDLMELLREKLTEDDDLLVEPDFVATEYTEGLQNFNHTFEPQTAEYFTLKRKRYFSDRAILDMMIEYYMENFQFTDSRGVTVERIYSDLNYLDHRKLILWVAYYLIDRKRMLYASSQVLTSQQNGESEGLSFKNTSRTITAKVGDAFTETINEGAEGGETGKGLEGFTALWGDQYSYLAKLQLWIRSRFEKQFADYSLRDNALVSSRLILEKSWSPDTYMDTTNFSRSTLDLIN